MSIVMETGSKWVKENSKNPGKLFYHSFQKNMKKHKCFYYWYWLLLITKRAVWLDILWLLFWHI